MLFLFLLTRVTHELELKMQLAEEELKTKAITIERQSRELEDRANQERKQDKEMQVHIMYTPQTLL